MKIKNLECWSKDLKLTEPYTIAYETIDTSPHVFLKLQTESGLVGWGCAAPDLEVTGETAAGVLGHFQQTIEPYLRGKSPFQFALILDELRTLIPGNPSALAMVDMALYDLVGKKAGVPLYQLLGGYRDSIPTSITIGILPVAETVEKARQFIASGFKILKIKGGSNLEQDIEKIRKVREAVGAGIELRFDANQGFSVEQSVQFIRATQQAGIELLEQPTAKENESLMGEVSQRVQVPIMADESLMTLKDVFRLSSNNYTDMINIKLMKVGGITEGMHINSVAKSAGIESMVGCMDESALGIAAGLHFALSRPNILYADLDGHFDLEDDPFAGMIRLKEGVLYPPELPGLGWKGA
ncbi:MAG: L-Ala-D/L-Glu epimerase [Saprospiraceae bacterium]|nr:MAG: L-Ala-D/L-Glu epimerase [Saprospiraceae bacterium]